ncbi:MAG: DUF84 family protein [Acidobacteriota bacterium]
MTDDHKPISARDFWHHVGSGLEVAVAASGHFPDKMLGVRDGFRRYFHEGLGMPASVAVTPRLDAEEDAGGELPMEDEEILGLARRRARRLHESAGADALDFVVGTESGLGSLVVDGEVRLFVRSWTVIFGPGAGEACGSSGSLQLPQSLIDGQDRGAGARSGIVPGTRRGGGLVRSLTFGLETRRRATELATVHALASLLFSLVDPQRRA